MFRTERSRQRDGDRDDSGGLGRGETRGRGTHRNRPLPMGFFRCPIIHVSIPLVYVICHAGRIGAAAGWTCFDGRRTAISTVGLSAMRQALACSRGPVWCAVMQPVRLLRPHPAGLASNDPRSDSTGSEHGLSGSEASRPSQTGGTECGVGRSRHCIQCRDKDC